MKLIYQASQNLVIYPSYLIQKEAKRRFGGKIGYFGGSGFKDNFAQIGVYFQSLNTKRIYEEPKYTVNLLTIWKDYFMKLKLAYDIRL